MKRHSAWIAFGLLLFVVLACNLSKNKNSNIAVNINSGTNRPANAEVYTDEVRAAKSEDGEATSTFSPSDRTVHVVINLNKAKAGTDVRVVWFADEVEGASNKELKTLEYTTKASDRKIPGYLRWSQDWPKGRYRVAVYINGNLDRTIYYDVQ
ncbi:MAG TPA: hypothetical protein VGW32_11545 [Pyrinomonadaceae bacterium]|nr:hypothetical protein [Pyrinomonadaceae bacterium]